jgi:lipoprotein NlpI
VRYARDLYWTGDLAGARQSFDRVLATNPRDADAWAGLAAVSRVEGDFAAAISAARRSLVLDPAQEYARDELRRARAGQRDP